MCLSCNPAHPLLPQIDGNELKSALRNSGAIAGMYKESPAPLPLRLARVLGGQKCWVGVGARMGEV